MGETKRLPVGNTRPDNPYFSKIIEKGFRILSLFDENRDSWTLKEISDQTGINRTSTFRFVETLIVLGYLRKESGTKVIKLGPRTLTLSYQVIKSFDLLQIVKPLIDRAYEKYRVSIDSAVLANDSLLTLYRKEAADTLTFRLLLVSKFLHCSAVGKAALAFLPDEEKIETVQRMEFIPRTPYSITSPQKFLAELETTRTRGYSLNAEEYLLGLVSIGAPLINPESRRAIGAISFDFPTVLCNMKEAEQNRPGGYKPGRGNLAHAPS